ncbi:growth arrest-specific protein 6 [Lates japonicus]|uniref:Growth arrest-specific protein 6 n=1 Tax=Lates japonicus TaxID=270547 RepID=A0AAD3RIN9_LATJO|nr:growth arrest-specific protein 6 [Lates japonicus]
MLGRTELGHLRPEKAASNIPDQCSPSPCNARGTVRCEDKKGDFLCHCFAGWTGARCEKANNSLLVTVSEEELSFSSWDACLVVCQWWDSCVSAGKFRLAFQRIDYAPSIPRVIFFAGGHLNSSWIVLAMHHGKAWSCTAAEMQHNQQGHQYWTHIVSGGQWRKVTVSVRVVTEKSQNSKVRLTSSVSAIGAVCTGSPGQVPLSITLASYHPGIDEWRDLEHF